MARSELLSDKQQQQKGATSSAPPKKWARSQSPRAMERRRLQNRLAQRNHRRKLKEQSCASSESSNDSNEHPEPPSPPADQFIAPATMETLTTLPSLSLSPTMDAIMAEEVKSAPPWPVLDSMVPPLGIGSGFASNNTPYFFSPPQSCTCNHMTGPCARHLEELRFQFMSTPMTGSPLPLPSSTRSRSGTASSHYEGSPTLSAVPFDGTTSCALDLPQLPQSIIQPQTNQQPFSPPPPGPAVMPNPTSNAGNHVSAAPVHRETPTTTKRPQKSNTPSPSSNNTKPKKNSLSTSQTSSKSSKSVSNCHDVEMSNGNTANDDTASNTIRFKKILNAVREAGFPDFDRMVAAYYTTSFEKGSMPDMAQRASRARRLSKMLKDVHESSSHWPRWEARGLRESTVESAKSVCAEEIEHIAQHLDNADQPNEADLLSALNDNSMNAMAIDGDGGEETKCLSQLTSLPEDVEAAVQDEAPYLWSLFTELAGPQGLYCDRVSQAVLALLIHGRRSQGR